MGLEYFSYQEIGSPYSLILEYLSLFQTQCVLLKGMDQWPSDTLPSPLAFHISDLTRERLGPFYMAAKSGLHAATLPVIAAEWIYWPWDPHIARD